MSMIKYLISIIVFLTTGVLGDTKAQLMSQVYPRHFKNQQQLLLSTALYEGKIGSITETNDSQKGIIYFSQHLSGKKHPLKGVTFKIKKNNLIVKKDPIWSAVKIQEGQRVLVSLNDEKRIEYVVALDLKCTDKNIKEFIKRLENFSKSSDKRADQIELFRSENPLIVNFAIETLSRYELSQENLRAAFNILGKNKSLNEDLSVFALQSLCFLSKENSNRNILNKMDSELANLCDKVVTSKHRINFLLDLGMIYKLDHHPRIIENGQLYKALTNWFDEKGEKNSVNYLVNMVKEGLPPAGKYPVYTPPDKAK